MESQEKAIAVIIFMITAMITFCIVRVIVDDAIASRHPDVSKCEEIHSPDNRDAWYECPISMGR
jgi:hypothetical protein